jgi:hypothetical protein
MTGTTTMNIDDATLIELLIGVPATLGSQYTSDDPDAA